MVNWSSKSNRDAVKRKLWQRTHWIFDLDGTLTEPILDFPAIKAQLGLPSDQGILESLGEMSPQQADPLHEVLDQIEAESAQAAIASSGARSLVKELAAAGKTLGILTRNRKRHAVRTLAVTQMLPYFQAEHILGREEAPFKPDPGGILGLLSLWKASARDAVMVGDFLFDLQAGRSAGTATIHLDASGGFPYGHWADLAVSSLCELVPLKESKTAN